MRQKATAYRQNAIVPMERAICTIMGIHLWATMLYI